jgi:hypothetical protein
MSAQLDMPVIPKPGTRKNKYFDNSNVFMLSGHGAEHLGERYPLGVNEYCAIPVSAGQITSTVNEVMYSKFYDLDSNTVSKISIPDNNESLTRKSFGFGSAIKQVSLGKGDEAVPLEQFKLYKPAAAHSKRTDFYKTSVPNLSFYPVSIFSSRSMFDPDIEFTYNKVNYNTNDIDLLDLTLSGILRRNQRVEFNKNETAMGPLYISDDKALVAIGATKGFRRKTIKDIVKNKKKDPMSYDCLQWIKSSFKGSMLTFNDMCLVCLMAYDMLSDFKFDDLAAGGFGENFIRARSKFNDAAIEQLSEQLQMGDILHDSHISLQTVFYLLNHLWNVKGPYIVLSPICRELGSDHGPENIKFMREKSR